MPRTHGHRPQIMAGHTMCGLDEDLDRGRIYMPQDDLRLDVDLERRAVTTEWRPFLAYEIERNRVLYSFADTWSRCCRHDRPGVSDRPGTPYAFSHLVVDDEATIAYRTGAAFRLRACSRHCCGQGFGVRRGALGRRPRVRGTPLRIAAARGIPAADLSNPDKTTPQSAWGMSLDVLRHSVLT